jgi:hypothetical protein
LALAGLTALAACGGGDADDDDRVDGAPPTPDAGLDAGVPVCGTGNRTLPPGLLELGHDDGAGIGHIGNQTFSITISAVPYSLKEEKLHEAVRFELEHPARIHGFAVQWGNLGPDDDPRAELPAGLYPDFGYNGFDFWRWDPLWEGTRCREDIREGEWTEYVFPTPIDMPDPGLVYVGHLRDGAQHGAAAPGLLFDEGTTQASCEGFESCSSAMNLPEIGTASYYQGVSFSFQYDFLVRLYVEYTEELPAEERLFQQVPDLSLGNRVAWGDYDDDGWDDLLTAGPRLYHNEGGTLVEVTGAAGLGGLSGSGGVFGDYDNDGCLDLFLFAESHTLADTLLHSQCDGTFVDATVTSGIDDTQTYNDCGNPANIRSPSAGAAWLDLDADGFLDLYVANFICWDSYTYYVDTVFHNLGDGTFEDWTATRGFLAAATASRGAAPIDHDGDGDVDLLVNNYVLQANLFFQNEGGGIVSERGYALGLAGDPDNVGAWYYGHTIGAAWGDLDSDGDFDVIQANLAHPRFYHFSDKTQVLANDGTGHYVDLAGDWSLPRSDAGLRYQETHSSPVLADFDADGHLDLVITAVYDGRPTDFYWGQGDGTFALDAYGAGLTTENGWGVAAADYDNDGDPDLALYNLFENTHASGGHFLQARIVGNAGANRAGIGATVTVSAGGRQVMRHVQGGSGQGCQDSATLHFGLGDAATVDTITVVFPGGATTTFAGPIAADQRVWLYQDGTMTAGWTP